ncbi:hypothetical protein IPZ68_08215 [Streptomyces arenae]|nr:hypothetical protein [Streptomyces arenae]
MDAGLAAVCGALAGSVATIGAALAAGWAQREGARIAARSVYQKEQRQPRMDAYRSLITHAAYLAELEVFDPSDMSGPASMRIEGIEAAWLEISLIGPASVLAASSNVRRCALLTQNALISVAATAALPNSSDLSNDPNSAYAQTRERMHEAKIKGAALMASVEEFRKQAQSVIENDGSVN